MARQPRERLAQLERRLVEWRVARGAGSLDEPSEGLVRYALGLARIGRLRVDDGTDLEAAEMLAPFRGWLLDMLFEPLVGARRPDVARVHQLRSAIRAHTDRVRGQLLSHLGGGLSPARLDREVGRKELVLVLGGGGGAGFAHLGAFSLLGDMGLRPRLIVGSSMGALLGLFRALSVDWDPVGTLLSLPRRFDFGSIFQPFLGSLRYGFPGAVMMRLREIARITFELLVGRSSMRLSDLPIPLEVVVTGVRVGMKAFVRELDEPLPEVPSLTGLGVRRKAGAVVRLIRTLTSHPRFLEELVFGRDELTRRCSAIDTVGFSCAVPGVLCYDLSRNAEAPTVEAFDTLFDRHRLWGLTDGGVVNNVPSRVAREAVESGRLGSRNAFIYALDPFAPRMNGNVLFMPLQRVAYRSVEVNQAYADLHRTYASPPSPWRIALGWARLRRVIERSRAELESDRPYLEAMMKPLPAYERLGSAA